jgi:hypothetical protein
MPKSHSGTETIRPSPPAEDLAQVADLVQVVEVVEQEPREVALAMDPHLGNFYCQIYLFFYFCASLCLFKFKLYAFLTSRYYLYRISPLTSYTSYGV